MMQLMDILEYGVRGMLLLYLCSGAITIKSKFSKQGKYIFFLLFVIYSFWLGNSEWLQNLLYGKETYIQKSSTSIIKVFLSLALCFLLINIFYEGSRLLKFYLALLFGTIIELSRFGVHCFWNIGLNSYINHISNRFMEGKIDIEAYNYAIEHVEPVGLMILAAAYAFISWLSIYYIRKYRKNMQDIDRQGIMFLMITPAVGMAFGLMMRVVLYTMEGGKIDFLYDKYKAMYVIVPSMVFLCILSIVYSIKIYEELILAQEEKGSLIYYRQQMSDMSVHIQEMERLYDGIRGVRHDMNNYIADMEQLLSMSIRQGYRENMETDEEIEAKKYLYHMKDALDSLSLKYITGNPITDVIINRKYQECKRREIDFKCDFIYPEKLGIEAFDIGILLNNALDNAVEAYECSGTEVRNGIRVHSYIKGRMFFIKVENDCDSKSLVYADNSGLKTSKEDKLLHGIGLKNMKRVVESYYGTMSYEIKEEVFCISMMLQGRYKM